MNWKEIYLDEKNNTFSFRDRILFQGHSFLDALKFHAPGLAPVMDKSGWYHIDVNGTAIYRERYLKAFGFYNERASVITEDGSIPINTNGEKIGNTYYDWCGNFQENVCTVRNKNGQYFHIDLEGNLCYPSTQQYSYAGDFKGGYACVMNEQQQFTHINKQGDFLHGKWFDDLGVFHKKFATARDKDGWFHIDFSGKELYPHRFAMIEPFYNGRAFVEDFSGRKVILLEDGALNFLRLRE